MINLLRCGAACLRMRAGAGGRRNARVTGDEADLPSACRAQPCDGPHAAAPFVSPEGASAPIFATGINNEHNL